MAPKMALGALVIGMLVAAPYASGQAAVDQYVPQGNPGGGSTGHSAGPGPTFDSLGPGGGQPGPKKIEAKTPKGSSSGAKLPATDYPATPFVWIVVAVLLAGALVRVAAPVLGQRGARNA